MNDDNQLTQAIRDLSGQDPQESTENGFKTSFLPELTDLYQACLGLRCTPRQEVMLRAIIAHYGTIRPEYFEDLAALLYKPRDQAYAFGHLALIEVAVNAYTQLLEEVVLDLPVEVIEPG